jgi:putative Mg2+ transporter-C (MgtC) family protein
VRLAVAAALGGAIGLERELREREAGLRTHLLVATGAALFTIVSAYGWRDFRFSNASGVTFDPTRIAAQIVSGIGFLGAGAIIRQGLSIRGLTTAATLWFVAAIGIACGAGYWSGAVIGTALVLFALSPLRVVGSRLHSRGRRLLVQLAPGTQATDPVLRLLESLGARVESFALDEAGQLAIDIQMPRGARAVAVTRLGALAGVTGARWET